MRKYGLFFVISILLIVMGGCKEMITKDDLIGGMWVPKAGYKDGEASGEPLCPPFDKGLEFKDEEMVYVKDADKDFKYHLRKSDDGMEIEFFNPNGEFDFYKVFIENDNGLGLVGSGISKNHNCYFEQKK